MGIAEPLSSRDASFAPAIRAATRGEGVALLLNDPGLYNDLRRVLTRVDSLTADFKKNPKRYINLEIF